MRRVLAGIAAVVVIAASLAFPAVASADFSVLNQACGNGNVNATACNDKGTATNPVAGPKGIIHNVTIILARITGAIAVIVIIYGGFQLVIGGNDPGKVKTARETIIYALVGLIIIVVGQTLIIFIVDRV